jgi:hypothetical protein
MMPASFETIKRLALEKLSVADFLSIPLPFSSKESRLQRSGESNVDAIDRARRESAILVDEHCRELARRLAAENAARVAREIRELRVALRRFADGGDDDVSHACRVLLKRIDRQ